MSELLEKIAACDEALQSIAEAVAGVREDQVDLRRQTEALLRETRIMRAELQPSPSPLLH